MTHINAKSAQSVNYKTYKSEGMGRSRNTIAPNAVGVGEMGTERVANFLKIQTEFSCKRTMPRVADTIVTR